MATFPGRPPNPLGLKVEINLAGTWTDISKFILQRNMLHITNVGRVDEASGIQAAQLTLTLKNQDGRFTPKNASGAYYPNIIRNTPIRVSVSATSTASVNYSGSRFYGQITSWPPTSDISQRDVYVQVTANGIWQQISQSQVPIGSAYTRYVRQLTGTSVPATSWTMEDGNGAVSFATGIGAGAAATFTGTPSFAQDGTSFPGTDALPQFNAARITANVSSGATATNAVVRFALAVPAAGDSITTGFAGGGEVANVLMPSGTGVKRMSVSLVGNQLVIQGWAATTGGSALWTGVISTKVNGVPVLVSAELTPSGSSVNWALRIIKPGAGAVLDQVTGTQATSTIAAVTQVTLNIQGRLGDTTFGQLGVFYAVPSLVTAASALGGFAGETAVARFQRLCAEFSITSEVIGSASAAMGPQVDDTLANQFQMIEATDGGLLFEAIDQFALGYRTLASMQNQSVAVTLNYALGTLGAPLAATYDNALTKNQWAVANFDGYTALATLATGALSIQQVPNGVGLYSGQVTINANTHAQVNAIAQQRLFQGTVDDIRYPQVTTDLRRGQVASLFATVPGLRVGDYMQVTNLPAFEGNPTAKQLVWGWDETLNAFSWSQVFNTVPELPFETSFSPGTFSVVQAPAGTVAAGSQVGASVAGSQIGGGVAGSIPTATLTARGVGGSTSFIAAATPYDWTFAVSGTPADATYFIGTQDQAAGIAVGDTFINTGGFGGPFTVTSVDPPSGGNVTVHFTPDASGVMSSGTVQGGKNGDTWVNLSAGNQVNQWTNGGWVPLQFGPTATGNTGAVLNTNPYFTAGDGTTWSGFQGTFAVTASPPAGAPYPYAGQFTITTASVGAAMEEGGVPVVAGQQYLVSAWVWSTQTTCVIGFDWNTAAHAYISTTTATVTIAASTWVKVTTVQTAAALAAFATPRIAPTDGVGHVIYAQAVVVQSQVPGSLIQANTITANQITANTITAGQLAAGIVYAGIVDATTVQASSYIATSAGGEFFAYDTSTPTTGHLVNCIAGSSGTDSVSNTFPKGLYSQQLTLNNQGSAPPAFSGASVYYSSTAGRPRYLSSAGADSVVARAEVNVGTQTLGDTTTPTEVSAQFLYIGGEASQSSEFGIEIFGNGRPGNAGLQSLTFAWYADGLNSGAQFTVGTGAFQINTTFDYHVRFVLCTTLSGASGTGHISAESMFGNSGGSRNPANSTVGGTNLDGWAWDTTANHTFAIRAWWGGTPQTGQTITSHRTGFYRNM